jgi:hypothetical protein
MGKMKFVPSRALVAGRFLTTKRAMPGTTFFKNLMSFQNEISHQNRSNLAKIHKIFVERIFGPWPTPSGRCCRGRQEEPCPVSSRGETYFQQKFSQKVIKFDDFEASKRKFQCDLINFDIVKFLFNSAQRLFKSSDLILANLFFTVFE